MKVKATVVGNLVTAAQTPLTGTDPDSRLSRGNKHCISIDFAGSTGVPGGGSLNDRIKDICDFHHPHPEGSSTERTEAPEGRTGASKEALLAASCSGCRRGTTPPHSSKALSLLQFSA